MQDQTASPEQKKLFHLYGLFLCSWGIAENVVQTAIWMQLGVDLHRANLVTAKLQFYPRAQLLRNLLKMHGNKYAEAMTMLEKLEAYAHRNILVHGQMIIGDPLRIKFVKSEGSKVLMKSFQVHEMAEHVIKLNQKLDKLMELLGVSPEAMQEFVDYQISLATEE